jgi:hypothetical protein
VEKRVWFFGGLTKEGAVADLHCLDLAELKVSYPRTFGAGPPAGAAPLLAADGSKIIVWSPAAPACIFVLSIESMQWTRIATEHIHRSAIAGAVAGGRLWLFGASLEPTAIAVDLEDLSVAVVKTAGPQPPDCGRLVAVGTGWCIVAIGDGVFVFDCRRSMWVRCAPGGAPDRGPTACFYVQEKRALLAVWGGTGGEVAVLEVGEQFAELNQQLDLLAMIGA